jgi:hypothetical protein
VFDDLSCSRTLVFITVFSSRGRKMPVGTSAWLAIALFGLIDASCFQVFTSTPFPAFGCFQLLSFSHTTAI